MDTNANKINVITMGVACAIPGAKVEVKEFPESNRTSLGVVIEKENSNLVPVISIDAMLEDNLNPSEIITRVVEIYRNAEPISFDMEEVLANARQNVFPTLMSIKGNEEYLKDKVYDIFLDLAIVYRVKTRQVENEVGSFVLTKGNIGAFKINSSELCSLAVKNIPEMEAIPLATVIAKQLGIPTEIFLALCGMDDTALSDMIMVRSDEVYGANVILNEGNLKELAKKYGAFYIMPSSINEVIIIPKYRLPEEVSVSQLERMVQEANADAVEPEERLSDSVYFFDGNKLTIVG